MYRYGYHYHYHYHFHYYHCHCHRHHHHHHDHHHHYRYPLQRCCDYGLVAWGLGVEGLEVWAPKGLGSGSRACRVWVKGLGEKVLGISV